MQSPNIKTPQKASLFDWREQRARDWMLQAIFLMLLCCFAGFIVYNTWQNLVAQKIATGFGFLDNSAGFDIAQKPISYTEEDTYFRAFLLGIINTAIVSVTGILMATGLGLAIGLGRLSTNWLVRRLSTFYVEVIRNTPLLLQIFLWYTIFLKTLPGPRNSIVWWDSFYLNVSGLFVPHLEWLRGLSTIWLFVAGWVVLMILFRKWNKKRQDATGRSYRVLLPGLLVLVLGLVVLVGSPLTVIQIEYPEKGRFNVSGGIQLIPELVALFVALSTYTAAFIAEIVRAGIQSVAKGQKEAAAALGLSNGQRTRWVVLPQALRVIIPPLSSQYLNLVKNSSLAAVIGYPDLVAVFAGTALNQTGQAIEILFMTMCVYLSISLFISFLMNVYNRRVAIVQR